MESSMIAFVSNSRIFDFFDNRKPAFTARDKDSGSHFVDAGVGLRVARSFALVVRQIGRMLERHRHAEIARQSGPLSLDDAWAGGWYARSQIRQEALLQRGCPTSAKPSPRRLDWDDKLD
jgi:hypothetical protein